MIYLTKTMMLTLWFLKHKYFVFHYSSLIPLRFAFHYFHYTFVTLLNVHAQGQR